ncbi:MAG: hypothetical protein WCK67_07810 [bacterium]
MNNILESMKNFIKPATEYTKNAISGVADYYCKSPENKVNLLTWTYLATTIASSACQLISIKQNKNISEEKKNFLLPQEAIDAVLNAGLYLALTKSAGDFGKYLVDNGKIFSKTPQVGDALKQYKAGVGVIFSMTGSILATCLVTPFARNKLAAIFQNHMNKNKNLLNEQPKLEPKAKFDTGKTINKPSVINELKPPVKTIKQPVQMNDFLLMAKSHSFKV